MSKYNNIRTTISGHTFDSRHEAERYIVLRSMEKRAGLYPTCACKCRMSWYRGER